MRFPFVKAKNGGNDCRDEYPREDYPAVQGEGSRKGGNILLRIALYSGVFLVILSSAGGYYYLNYTRGSLNKRISGNPSGLVKAIDLGVGENVSASREEPFIEEPSNKARTVSPTSPSHEPARQASLVGTREGAQATSDAPPLRKAPTGPRTVPSSSEKTSSDGAASSDQPETLLSNLVLRDDNPFRDKFLKRFQQSQALKTSLKGTGRTAGSGEASRSSRPSGAGRAASGLEGGELAILPDIAGGGDRPGGLKVVGVIQSQGISLALTNRGELRVGSLVDGDAVTGITINEVRLKSGRIVKVTAQ